MLAMHPDEQPNEQSPRQVVVRRARWPARFDWIRIDDSPFVSSSGSSSESSTSDQQQVSKAPASNSSSLHYPPPINVAGHPYPLYYTRFLNQPSTLIQSSPSTLWSQHQGSNALTPYITQSQHPLPSTVATSPYPQYYSTVLSQPSTPFASPASTTWGQSQGSHVPYSVMTPLAYPSPRIVTPSSYLPYYASGASLWGFQAYPRWSTPASRTDSAETSPVPQMERQPSTVPSSETRPNRTRRLIPGWPKGHSLQLHTHYNGLHPSKIPDKIFIEEQAHNAQFVIRDPFESGVFDASRTPVSPSLNNPPPLIS